MAIELWRGTAKGVVKTDEDGPSECHLGDNKIIFHRDLERSFKEGDDIIISGDLRKDALHAYAVRNMKDDKVTQIDGSNNILLVGAGLFFAILGFIFSIQSRVAGEAIAMQLNILLCIAGIITVGWAMIRVIRISRATKSVTYCKLD